MLEGIDLQRLCYLAAEPSLSPVVRQSAASLLSALMALPDSIQPMLELQVCALIAPYFVSSSRLVTSPKGKRQEFFRALLLCPAASSA